MKTATTCGTPLKVERYGGGHRYYCPHCDVRRDYLAMITWTNAFPQKSECQNVLSKKR